MRIRLKKMRIGSCKSIDHAVQYASFRFPAHSSGVRIFPFCGIGGRGSGFAECPDGDTIENPAETFRVSVRVRR